MDITTTIDAIGTIVGIAIFAGLVLTWTIYWYPKWRVWASGQKGKADLEAAQYEKQIQVAQAEGRLKAAESNKQAAIIEAEAVAKQIEVIGNNLTKHDLYLRWQWIKMMEEREGSTVYVPTEANLPILEAGLRK